MAKALVRDYPEIDDAVRLDMRDCIVRYDNKQFNEDGVLFTDQSFFKIFDYSLNQGDITTALREPNSIVLTESIAQKYFGAENPLGKTMTLYQYDPGGNGAPYKVTGVTPDPPQNAHFTFTILGSFNTYEAIVPEVREFWFENSYYTYLLLKEGVDPKVLEAKLPDFAERYMGDRMREFNMFYTYSLQPLADIHLNSHLRYEIQATGSLNTVYIFATIGLFILLIACINYMNLATARSLSRGKEVGVRKVLGAAKSQLLRQFLVESTIVSAVAFTIALLLVELLQPAFFTLTQKHLEQLFSTELLLLMTTVTLFIGLLSGLYPAFFISSVGAANVLKGNFKSTATGILTRKGLVVLQFSITIVLLIGIAVVKSQTDFVRSKDLGFDKDALLVLNVNGFAQVQNGIQPFKDELLANSNITGITISRGLIVGGLGNSLVGTIDGNGRAVSTSIYRHMVGLDYIDVYKMKISAGRNFSRADSLGGYIVNEAVVRTFDWGEPEDALGKPFIRGRGQGRIIGVVEDFHFSSLQNAIEPVALSLTRPNRFSRISVRLETANLAKTMEFVEQGWVKHFPAALFEYSFMDERLDRQYRQEKLFGNIFMTFVVLSLAIACLGLFGLAAFAAQQRTKEIGVRKVLGATVVNVVALLSKDFVNLVLFANLIAWPVAWFIMTRWLENFAYHIGIEWWMFTLAGGLALVIALLTVSTQAIRAALANPVEALRYE